MFEPKINSTPGQLPSLRTAVLLSYILWYTEVLLILQL